MFIIFSCVYCVYVLFFCFFFNDTATTEIYTLSLHDALPISWRKLCGLRGFPYNGRCCSPRDRKSTRLNSSHPSISYAVFCLKKKNKITDFTLKKKKKKQKNNTKIQMKLN